MGMGRFAESSEVCRDAVAIATAAGAMIQESRARNVLGSDLVALGEPDAGLAELRESRRLAGLAGTLDWARRRAPQPRAEPPARRPPRRGGGGGDRGPGPGPADGPRTAVRAVPRGGRCRRAVPIGALGRGGRPGGRDARRRLGLEIRPVPGLGAGAPPRRTGRECRRGRAARGGGPARGRGPRPGPGGLRRARRRRGGAAGRAAGRCPRGRPERDARSRGPRTRDPRSPCSRWPRRRPRSWRSDAAARRDPGRPRSWPPAPPTSRHAPAELAGRSSTPSARALAARAEAEARGRAGPPTSTDGSPAVGGRRRGRPPRARRGRTGPLRRGGAPRARSARARGDGDP